MKIGTMFEDVLKSLVSKPATVPYPVEARSVPGRTRGRLYWQPDSCTGCGLCAKDCPANAIEVITLDKKAKRFIVRYHSDRCIYCGQCVRSCRFNCLELVADEWELATNDLDELTILYGRTDDIAEALERVVADNAVDAE